MFQLVGIVLILAGAGFGYWVWSNQKKAKAALSWPKAPGVITVSQIDERHEQRSASDGPGTTRSYWPVVHYDYEVAGTKHTGSHIGFGNAGYPTRGQAQKQITPYAIGAKVDVLVDPANPDNAVLTPKVAVNWLFPIVFLVIGVIFLFIHG